MRIYTLPEFARFIQSDFSDIHINENNVKQVLHLSKTKHFLEYNVKL